MKAISNGIRRWLECLFLNNIHVAYSAVAGLRGKGVSYMWLWTSSNDSFDNHFDWASNSTQCDLWFRYTLSTLRFEILQILWAEQNLSKFSKKFPEIGESFPKICQNFPQFLQTSKNLTTFFLEFLKII